MSNRRPVLLCVCLCLGVGSITRAQSPPVAPVRPVVEDYFGTKVTDPYRYMENLKDPEVQAWIKGQADTTAAVLMKISGRGALLERLRELGNDSVFTVRNVSRIADGKIFYEKRGVGDDVFKLYTRAARGGPEKLLLDPETFRKSTGKPHAINYFTPSPDGRYLATGRGFMVHMPHNESVNIWDAHSGALIRNLPGPAGPRNNENNVTALAFSPDEQCLATGSWDGVIKMWNAASGALLWTSPAVDAIMGLAFSPDGRALASGATDGHIRIWDAASGTLLQTISGSPFGVNFIRVDGPPGSNLGGPGVDFTRLRRRNSVSRSCDSSPPCRSHRGLPAPSPGGVSRTPQKGRSSKQASRCAGPLLQRKIYSPFFAHVNNNLTFFHLEPVGGCTRVYSPTA